MANDTRSTAAVLAAAVVVATIVAIVLGGRWLDLVVELQSGPFGSLPAPDILSDYLMGVMWALLLGAGVLIWGGLVRHQVPLSILWLAKVFVALGPMLLYDYTYGVDPDGFFVNASTPGFTWQGLQLGQGTVNTQMLTWVHFHWLSSSYHATRLSFALIGLIAVFLTYRSLSIWTGREDHRILYALGLMPSVLFWSSTLSKDSLTFCGIAAYMYGVVAWYRTGKVRYVLWIVGGVALAALIRIWYAPILLGPVAIVGWTRSRSLAHRAMFTALALAGAMTSPTVMQLTLGIELRQDELLESTNNLSRVFQSGGSSQEVPDLGTVGEIAAFAPLGIFTALFRPLPGEVRNMFGTLAGLENLLILVLTSRLIVRTKVKELLDPLVLWSLLTVFLWAALYSIVSFQNLGTMSRYRLQIMPIFLGSLLYLGRRRQMVQATDSPSPVGARNLPVMRPGI